jgi:heterodisulfide reductase subunit C
MNSTTVIEESPVADSTPAADPLAPVREMVSACIQCGTCTGSCPNAFAMDKTPRHMWRMVLMGEKDAIFNSKTFILCSSCYYCTLRCPRGLPLTDAMSALKQIAARDNLAKYKQSTLFYKKFIESVRRHGRVREMEFMTLYFNALKSPLVPFKFAPLGLTLIRKGKVSIQLPSRGTAPLEKLFRKVEELEESTASDE